ncbi:MAG: NERD domain-containing protein [Clostridia bacterium]|nr:NERD domain-containing protein [Clostridia bacterium]
MSWSSLIPILAFVALIVLSILWRRSKGRRGEKQVAALLSLLPKDRYKVINDLLIQKGGHSTQIDHVVVSVYGVFVIETKYYRAGFTVERTVSFGPRTFMAINMN